MLTFNLPHFLPLLYLIIDCDLRIHALSFFFSHTRTHTHTHTQTHTLSLSLILCPFISLFFPLLFPATLSLLRFQSDTNLSHVRIERFAFRSLARVYIYSGINGSDIVDNKLFVSLHTTIHFIAKWRNPVERIMLLAHNSARQSEVFAFLAILEIFICRILKDSERPRYVRANFHSIRYIYISHTMRAIGEPSDAAASSITRYVFFVLSTVDSGHIVMT